MNRNVNVSGGKVPSRTQRMGIVPYPNTEGYTLSDGERSELVFITQLMLNALSLYYDLPYTAPNGSYDEVTMSAVREFQRANMLAETGEIDPDTWDRLAIEYNRTVNDSQ